ncbi:MAG: AAA family ATPase [Acidobacteriia bacterium]|nr:AAA family ATPase [Terriglobia bacterium]
MIRLPIIQALSVQNYALFPGPESERSGLTASFLPGLTLVLGANGLGKTTLVWLLYRMLSGPHDIPGLDKSGRLGRRRLAAQRMTPTTRRLFAQRVEDNARDAAAELQFDLGSAHVTVTRSLRNLDLLGFSIDGTDLEADEEMYQERIAALSGVWSFGDWILLLRYLTFYFEDRRALVWDPTAQTQLFRLLFLPPETAQQWTETEREILELDSQARNLRAALTREEQHLAKDEELELAAPEVKAELDALSDLHGADEEERERLDEAVVALYPAREKARLGLLDAEHKREEALRALEHAKLTVLRERFPTASETAQYILAQLFAEGECLACGNDAPEAAASLESRLHRSRCVVCDTPVGQPAERDDEITDLSEKRLASAAETLARANARLIASRTQMEESERKGIRGLLPAPRWS